MSIKKIVLLAVLIIAGTTAVVLGYLSSLERTVTLAVGQAKIGSQEEAKKAYDPLLQKISREFSQKPQWTFYVSCLLKDKGANEKVEYNVGCPIIFLRLKADNYFQGRKAMARLFELARDNRVSPVEARMEIAR